MIFPAGSRLASIYRRPRRHGRHALLLLCAVLVWFDSGQEWLRAEKAAISTPAQAFQRAGRFLWPPWVAPLAYVSHDTDEHLYYEYTRLMLGERVHLAWIADARGAPITSRDQLQLEYPKLSAIVMLLPRLVARSLPGYRAAFGALMAALFLGAWLIARRLGRTLTGCPAAELDARMLWATLALGSILVRRFDAVPALLTIAALACLGRRRPLAAGALLAVGAATKLYPLLLLPVWLALYLGAGERRAALRLGLGAGAAFALVQAALQLVPLPPTGAVGYYAGRPIQLESLLGGLLLAFGHPTYFAFGSANVQAPAWLERAWEPLLPLAVLGLSAGAYHWARRRRPEHHGAQLRGFARFTACTLLAIFCTAKVLSPQYLIWGLPLLVILPGESGAWTARAYVLALALTQLVYPIGFELVRAGTLPGVLLLLGRNATLVVIFARLLGQLVPQLFEKPALPQVVKPALLLEPEE